MSFRTLLIGRARTADVRLEHPTVSRRHAEATLTRSGRCYLIDCGSSRGTFRRGGDGQWVRHRQGFVDVAAAVRFGELETRLSALLGGSVSTVIETQSVQPEFESISIRPRRNIESGEVERVRDA